MAIFADTSGFFALLDEGDINHARAQATWRETLLADEPIVSHNYVLSESFALVQRRLGMDALITLAQEYLPSVEIAWVDPVLHERAVAAMLSAGLRGVSLVDYVSFEVMRRRGITAAFAYDDDFRRAGFTLAR